MLSIDGLEFAILGTGHTVCGEEVLIYDGYVVETLDFRPDEYLEQLESAGMAHMAPIFIYLDKGVRVEVCGNHRNIH